MHVGRDFITLFVCGMVINVSKAMGSETDCLRHNAFNTLDSHDTVTNIEQCPVCK
jgi:hypothetical protein